MIINDLDGYYIVFDTKNWNTELDTLIANTSPILFDGRDREGYQIVKTSFFRSSYWNKTVEYYGIVRWLYIDDLFTKEGGEQ